MQKNYDEFDATSYAHSRYGDVTVKDRVQFQLNQLHTFFQSSPPGRPLSVVDFGCGPVIQHSISAAGVASELIFADTAGSNRAAIQRWLGKDREAFDWSPHFNYVVKTLEGKGEEEAREREERMRRVTKAVVWCDYFGSEGIIEKGFEGPYDVVFESNSLQAACTTIDSYKHCVKLLTGLLKPGGTLILYRGDIRMDTTTRPYFVNEVEFSCLSISKECIRSILTDIGLFDVKVEFTPLDPSNKASYNQERGKNGYYFITAKTKLV